MLNLFVLFLFVAPIVFVFYAVKEYKYFKAGEKIKGAEGTVFVISGILSVVLLIALLSSSDDISNNNISDNTDKPTVEEYTDKPAVEEEPEPIEEEAPKAPEPQKEEPQEEKSKQMTLSEQVELAKIFVDQCAKEGFSTEDYKIEANTETGSIVLVTNMKVSVLQEGMNNPEVWNKVVDTMIQTNNSLSDNVKKLGCNDVTISIVAGDFSLDKAYVVVRDGVVLYDCVNNINTIGL